MDDDDAAMCRICYNLTEFRETLINPCQCTGTLQYVHKSCLERQLEDTDSEYCGECLYHFQIVKTKRTFRGWLKSSGSSPLRKDQGRRVIVRLFSYTLSFIWHVLFLWMNLLGAFWFTKENNSVLGIVVMCLVSPISIGTLISLLVDFTWKFCIDFPIWREKHWHVRIRGDNDNPTN